MFSFIVFSDIDYGNYTFGKSINFCALIDVLLFVVVVCCYLSSLSLSLSFSLSLSSLSLSHSLSHSLSLLFSHSLFLTQVPGGASGPGGVIILAEGSVAYHAPNSGTQQKDLVVELPQRCSTFGRATTTTTTTNKKDGNIKKNFIVCVASIVQREQKIFFCLLQDESGDLFRLTLNSEEEEGSSSSKVSAITLTYFDTIPVCTSMCISRNGLLFATSEVRIKLIF